MKGYGLPRNTDVSAPDVLDIHTYGLKTSAGQLPGKGGDAHSYFRNSEAKARARRTWKRAARAEGKAACRGEEG